MAQIAVQLRNAFPISIPVWIAIWTAIGALFALQLRWHYGLSWSLSLFWGFADYYLWSVMALFMFAGINHLVRQNWSLTQRGLIYLALAPVVLAVHVLLTMVVGSVDGEWVSYFRGLYIKKLTINVLTYGALVAIGDRLAASAAVPKHDRAIVTFLAKRGDRSRKILPAQIIWGEVSGNYVNLHTREGAWPVRQSLTEFAQQLPADQFVKISRSSIVNLSEIQSLITNNGKMRIALSSGEVLDVSRRCQPTIRQAFKSSAP